jgi:RNA polymerase sigma-70 factor (ECF subfamily)
LCAEVFLATLKNDFAILRNFRGKSSLATYLTVVARRIVVKELLSRMASSRLRESGESFAVQQIADPRGTAEKHVGDQEEIQRLLGLLDGPEAEVVRMYHLEGKSYQEISVTMGIPENSIGPTLTRAREKMRRASLNSTAS